MYDDALNRIHIITFLSNLDSDVDNDISTCGPFYCFFVALLFAVQGILQNDLTTALIPFLFPIELEEHRIHRHMLQIFCSSL